MSNYIANSKNRKLKKQILLLLERINFGAGKLPFSWRVILFMNFLFLLSLALPWFHFQYRNNQVDTFFAFSEYTGYFGYGVVFAVVIIPFFLVSHTKKERIRAYIPFRLSDTQAIVFISSILLSASIHLLLISQTFHQFALDVEVGNGFLLFLTSCICVLISAFFLSKATKEQSMDMRYLQHNEWDQFQEYRDILNVEWKKDGSNKDTNMTLPI